MIIRPYQSAGLEFLTSHPRAALFDEPGLGKSMQALLAMRDLIPDGRILIVGTGDSIGVWQDETRLWLEEEPLTVHGTKSDPLSFGRADGIVITNYSRLPTAMSEHWDGVIFDEAQALRNRNTRTLYKTVSPALTNRQRGMQSSPVFFLSGTPVVKAAGDLWPILHAIDKRRWSSYWNFVKEYCVTWEDEFGWHVEGITNAARLWADLEPWVLRRLQKEVQPDLPPLVRQRVPLRMTTKQARAYWQLEADMVAEVGTKTSPSLLLAPTVLARETRLRQLLVCPRLVGVDENGAALDSLCEIAATTTYPFVVFTPFAEALPMVEAALLKANANRPIYRVRGGMGSKFKDGVDLFKATAKSSSAGPILLASVQMAKSWSVSAVASTCYMLGFDWNEVTMRQAEFRLSRDGQKETVFSHYFVHQETHDEDALEVLAGKRRLADVILDRVIRRRFR